MLSQSRVELTFKGTIPSKKNSRVNTKDGQSFPNKKFVQWQDDSIVELRRQTRHRFFKPVSLEVIIYFGTIGKADIDNKVTSLLDMFSEALIIPDDKWQHVPIMKVQAEYRPGNPGAFVRIEELPDGYFGEEYAAADAKRRAKKRV
jgi:Holliday junction resolvase RusA-like endonuclease